MTRRLLPLVLLALVAAALLATMNAGPTLSFVGGSIGIRNNSVGMRVGGPGMAAMKSCRRNTHAGATVEGRPIYSAMQNKLTEKLVPKKLVITDDSNKHSEHEAMVGKAAESGETHFTVEVVSDAFEGVGLVKRHRMIYEILKEELDAGVHALSLKTKTPKEAGL
eukprot:jgi/Bigna1/91348/estExt_fgenesh1_pg.C_980005